MIYKGQYYKRICYVGTIYSLFLYLCRYSLAEIKDTLFIFSYGIPKNIAERMDNCIFLDEKGTNNAFVDFCVRNRCIQWLIVMWYWYVKIPKFDGNEELFAQDHLFLSGFVCSRPYTLLEDGVGFIHNNVLNGNIDKCKRIRELHSYPLRKKLYGPASMHCLGDNPHCNKLLLTKKDDISVHIKEKPQEIIDIKKYWREATPEKQEYILNLYNLHNEDIETISSKPIIFFTQPLYMDGLPTKEQITLTKKILAKYNHDDVIIKTHPRDKINYRNIFPDILVFDKTIPSQLFDTVGLRFRKAVTIFSTAVCSFDYDTEIDWYGTEISENLLRIHGHIQPPEGVKLCSL